jgi:hypothetical protein
MKYLLLATALSFPTVLPAQSALPADAGVMRETSVLDVDDDGPLSEPRHIEFGMKPTQVVETMKGEPDEKLTPDIWVYWDFQSGIVGAGKFDTLVVFFGRDRVVKYRLVERKAVRALLAELRQTRPSAPLASR